MSKVKLLIVDDHDVVRTGLKLLFKKKSDFEIVADASNGKDALSAVKKYQPQVVITDISMDGMNGIELTKFIMADFPETSVLVLSMHNDEEYIIDALEAGAMGYIPKTSDELEIINAAVNVSKGKMYYSSSISDILAKRLIKKKKNPVIGESPTAREVEVMSLIVGGYSNKEIASQLFLSKRTIDNHRANLMRKLNAKNTADIVRIAILKELVNVDKKDTSS